MISLDQPVWRADLFDRVDGSPGAFEVAHFHPRFTGIEPSTRHWDTDIKVDPWRWLHEQLSDATRITESAGVTLREPAAESERVRADAPDIVAAAQTRAPAECRSKDQCFAWTSDAQHAVHLMLSTLERPDLLDRDRVSPWLASRDETSPPLSDRTRDR